MSLNFDRFRKISWKLTIIYSAIFSILWIFLSASILYGVRYFLINQSINQVESSTNIIIQNIIGNEKEQTDITDPELLSEAQSNREINIKIANSQGSIVNSSNNFNTKWISMTSKINTIMVVEKGEKHIVVKNSKIMSGNSVKSYIQVAKDMTNEDGFMNLLFTFLTIVNLIEIVLVVFVVYLTSKRILKPIDKITNTAKSISVRDLNERIEVKVADDELGRLAITFNEMIERLKISFDKQKQFVSDASHELRTPIGVIQGYVNLIDRWGKYDEGILNESIQAMKIETTNMIELIESLLFLARGDDEKSRLQRERFNLKGLAKEVINDSRLVDQYHDLGFDIDDKIFINADRKMIKQALRSLVDNSIKYTPENGKIEILAENIDRDIKIIVRDTGIGIPQDEIEKIFDRFYRVDKTRSKDAGGSGLGLSIVNWIVSVHDGKIFAESETGKGTKMIMLLPKG
ncbi:ATP-binding protein [Clostridium sp. WILCCON 0269]|uniref:histidine kinase n=1 Tax=Candidatus Clostridium eludens TaxID=3381663 RepID=A0ABW8SQY9_9CLOT